MPKPRRRARSALICADDRQYPNPRGQAWTTLDELEADHANEMRALEAGLMGLGSKPQIAIGQRALVIQRPTGGVMWDCTPLITDAAIDAINAAGGVKAIAISHPHFYATMVDWSRALGGVPILLHEDNRDWVMRPDPAIEFWGGEAREVLPGISLVRTGGHFPGSTVLHWAEGGGGRRRADDRRFHHGGAGHPLGELHVLLPQPHPGQRRDGGADREIRPGLPL